MMGGWMARQEGLGAAYIRIPTTWEDQEREEEELKRIFLFSLLFFCTYIYVMTLYSLIRHARGGVLYLHEVERTAEETQKPKRKKKRAESPGPKGAVALLLHR